MKTQKSTVLVGIFTALAVLGLFFAACGDPNGGGDPVLTGTVSISGTAKVGETLTADVSALGGDGTIAYQWKRGGSTNIGTNSNTYTVQAADEGSTITVTVTRSGYSGSKTSEPTATVTASGGPVTYTVVQTGGANGVSDSTGIVFTFSASIDSLGLTAADITVGGTASKGSEALSGTGTTRTLAITVSSAGQATVSIAKTGIEAETKEVTVYKAGQHTHEWGEWEITTPATCTTVGERTRTCTLDGTTDTEEIPIDPDAHNWGDWTETTAPTCETAGEETRVCAHDVIHKEIRPVAALGHDWEWVTTPNFISAGVATRRCKHDPSHTENVNCPLPITTGEEWTIALSQLNGKTGEYTLTIDGNINVAGRTSNSFGNTANGSSLIVTLKGTGKLYLTSQGNLIRIAANQTLIIDSENLTLQGLTNGENGATEDNNNSVVYVGGTLELKNGIISGNTTSGDGGGVYIGYAGIFTMQDGEISGNTAVIAGGVYMAGLTFTMEDGKIFNNTATTHGGGVYVSQVNANFTLNGGEISANTVSYGGGVYISYGTFTMNDGKVSDNTVSYGGGGVAVFNRGDFTMKGGDISGNTVNTANSGFGGGVYVSDDTNATFTMQGGVISNNSATVNGGGVYYSNGTFTMQGGEISGNTASHSGGGVYNRNGTFTMEDGKIFKNTASTYGGGGVYVAGTFNMHSGVISSNTSATEGGGVYVYNSNTSVFRIVNGLIYGSDEADEELRNTATTSGAALYKETNGIAERGTFSGEEWIKAENGDLATTNDTIRVVEGVLIQ